jgi:hypothetical protein
MQWREGWPLDKINVIVLTNLENSIDDLWKRKLFEEASVPSRGGPCPGQPPGMLVIHYHIAPSSSQRDEPDRLCPRQFKGA